MLYLKPPHRSEVECMSIAALMGGEQRVTMGYEKYDSSGFVWETLSP